MLGVERQNSRDKNFLGSTKPLSTDKKVHSSSTKDVTGRTSGEGRGGGMKQYGSADHTGSVDAPLFALVFNGGSPAERYPNRVGTGSDKNTATRLGNPNGNSVGPHLVGGNNTITGHPGGGGGTTGTGAGPPPAAHRDRPPLTIRLDDTSMNGPTNSNHSGLGSSSALVSDEGSGTLVSRVHSKPRKSGDESEYPLERGNKGGEGDSCPGNPQATRVFSSSTPDPHAGSNKPRFGATTPMNIMRAKPHDSNGLTHSPLNSEQPLPPSIDTSRLARSNTETANSSPHDDEESAEGTSDSNSIRPHLLHLRPSSRQLTQYGSSPLDNGGRACDSPSSSKKGGDDTRDGSTNSSYIHPSQPSTMMANQLIFPQGSSHHSFRSGDLNHHGSHQGNNDDGVVVGSMTGSAGDVPSVPVMAVLSSARRVCAPTSPMPPPAPSSATGPPTDPPPTNIASRNRESLTIAVNSNGSDERSKNSGGVGGLLHSPGVLSQGSPGFTDDMLSPVPSFFDTKVPPPRLSSPSPGNSGNFRRQENMKSAADSRYLTTISPKYSDQHVPGLGDSDFGSQSIDCASGVHQLLFRQHSATPTDDCASFQMTPSGGTYVQGKPSLSFPLKTEKSGGASGSIGSGGKQRSDPQIVCQQLSAVAEPTSTTLPRKLTDELCIPQTSQLSSIEDPLDTARPSSSVETKIDNQHSPRLSIPPPPSVTSDEASQSTNRRRSVVVHPPPRIASVDELIRARHSHASVVSAGRVGSALSVMRTSSTVEDMCAPLAIPATRNRSSTTTSTLSPLQPLDEQFTENSESFAMVPLSRTKEGLSRNNSGDPTLAPESSYCPNSLQSPKPQPSGGSADTPVEAVMHSATEQDSRLHYDEEEDVNGNWRNVPIAGAISITTSPSPGRVTPPFAPSSVLKTGNASSSIVMSKSASHAIKDRSPIVSVAGGAANKSAGEGGASSSAGLTGGGGTGASSGNTVNNALSGSANANEPASEKQVTYNLDHEESTSDSYPIFLSSQQAVRRREGCCFRFLNNLPLLRILATILQVIIVIMAIIIIIVSLKFWKYWEVWMFSLSDEVVVTETRVLTVHILLISSAVFFFLTKWCCYWYIQHRRRLLVEAALRPMPKKKIKEKKRINYAHRLIGDPNDTPVAPPTSRRNSQTYADASYPFSPLSGRHHQHYDSGNYSDVPSVHFPPDENDVAGDFDGDEVYRRGREEEEDAMANVSSSHLPDGVVRGVRHHDDEDEAEQPFPDIVASPERADEDTGDDEPETDEDFECCCGNNCLSRFCGTCCDDDQAEEYITRKDDVSATGKTTAEGDFSSSDSQGQGRNPRRINSNTPTTESRRKPVGRKGRRRLRNDDERAEMSTSMIIDQRRRIYRTPRRAGFCRRLWRTCCRIPSLICLARLASLVFVIILLLLSVTSCLDGLIRFLMLSPVGYVWDANIKLKEDYMCKEIQMAAKCSGFSSLCNEPYYENNLTAQARMCPFCADEDQLIISNYTRTCEDVFKEKRETVMTTFAIFLCLMMVLTVLSTLVFTSSLLSGAWVEKRKRS